VIHIKNILNIYSHKKTLNLKVKLFNHFLSVLIILLIFLNMNIILSMAIRKRISDYFFKRPTGIFNIYVTHFACSRKMLF